MMKANYLIALVCISLAACGDSSPGPTTREGRIQMLKEDLDKNFGTGRIGSAIIREDGMYLETEKRGKMVIPLRDLEDLGKLEHGASMDGKENPSFLHLQLFNNANAAARCKWENCDDFIGQRPSDCPYAC